MGLPLRQYLTEGVLLFRQIDSAEMSPGQFAHMVLRAVDEGASTIVIDSLSGYLSTMPEERFLSAHVHELLTSLSHRHVITVLTLVQHGVVGEHVSSPMDVSYLADTVLLLRYFETAGEIRRAISVVKKRTGAHEVFVREMRIDSTGIVIGEPLRAFRGVLSGRPEFTGDAGQLVR
jgi:circadian clock protein KaiC